MNEPFFSLIIWAHDTDFTYFKDCLESLVQQTYQKYEIYVLDESKTDELSEVVTEFFPESERAHYRKLKKKNGGAYAYNIGSHFAEGDYLIYLGQHDRLSVKALEELAHCIENAGNPSCVIYSDHDELIGLDRMNPHFKGGFNKELLLRNNYIGDLICISCDVVKKAGTFIEKADYAYMYEYLLRCSSRQVPFYHVPGLLFHKRMPENVAIHDKQVRKERDKCHVEHMAVAQAYLQKENVIASFEQGVSDLKWAISYDGSDYKSHRKDYIFLHDKNVRMLTRRNLARMYGYLKQPDVAVVGIRFLGSLFTVDNIGYIFDRDGTVYPAFHGQKIYHESYEGLAMQPRDVSMVDAGYCMIDAKVFRGLHGFDPNLSGRDAMLDFCLRARAHGYRIVVDPACIGRFKNKEVESTLESHEALMEKQGSIIAQGDPYYNSQLPMGLINYVLPGQEEEI